jgi:hypothetical protein
MANLSAKEPSSILLAAAAGDLQRLDTASSRKMKLRTWSNPLGFATPGQEDLVMKLMKKVPTV